MFFSQMFSIFLIFIIFFAATPAIAKRLYYQEADHSRIHPPAAPLAARWDADRGTLARWYPDTPVSEEEFFARGSKALGLLNEDSQVYLIISGQTGAIPMSNHRFKRYGQTYKDYRVKDAGLVLSLDLAGNIVSVFNSLQPITGFHPSPTLSQEASREIAVEGIDMSTLRGAETVETVIAIIEGEPRLVHQWLIPAREPYGDWEILIDANSGEIVEKRDLRIFYVTGRGQVFIPDPKTAIECDTLVDGGDSNAAIPPACYSTVDLPELDDPIGGLYYLSGRFVDTSPTQNRAVGTSPDFIYLRQDDRFEEANVYYHLDAYHRYMISLGYGNIIDRPQQCDVNGTTEDNSWFSPLTGIITYGSGGVDDGEDADVIIHEYGHAIQYDIQGGLTGGHTGAMGEGFSDYIAGTYSLRINLNFHPEWVFTWDGHNQFWAGRWLNRPYHYPEHANGQIHDSGQLWSAGLIDVWYDVISTEIWDAIVFQHHYYLGNGATMEDAANAILLADININNAAYRWTIIENFTQRGFVDSAYLVPAVEHIPLRDSEDTARVEFDVTARITSGLPLDSSSILLYWGIDGIISGVEVFQAIGGGSFTTAIPGPFNRSRVNYYISAPDIYGGLGLNPPGAPALLHSFYVGPDTIPPVIEVVSAPSNTIFRSGRGEASITARDNLGISEVVFNYRQEGGIYQSFAMTPAGGDTFAAEFFWYELQPSMSFLYYFSVVDNSFQMNRSVSPERSFMVVDSILFDDFESGMEKWVSESGWGVQNIQYFSPRSAVNDRAGAGTARFEQRVLTLADSWLLSGLPDLNFAYWTLHLFLPQNDTGFVEISQGTGWEALDTVTGVSPGWERRVVRLRDYINADSLAVRFRTITDTTAAHAGPGWYIDDIVISTEPLVGVQPENVHSQPSDFTIDRISPNPGNGEFIVRFYLSVEGLVKASVYNLLGKRVAALADEVYPPGLNSIRWRLDGPSGLYFARIECGGKNAVGKILLIK